MSTALFVRTGSGQTLGPLDEGQLRSLITQRKLGTSVMVSEDGELFAPPGQFLHLRNLFPPELWGQGGGVLRGGDLANLSALHAYVRIASAEATGQLEFTLPDRKIEMTFRRGNPDAVDSTHPEDGLEPFLAARGVDPAKLEKAKAGLAQFGGDLLAALFGQGLANPATLIPLLGQRSQQIALKAMLATTGTFRFTEGAPAKQAMPLGNRWAVLVELVRRIPTLELRRRLADVRQKAPMRSGGKVSTDDLRLTPRELRALSNVDGVRTLEALVAQSPADEEHLLRMVLLLRELDAMTFSGAEPAPSRPAPQAPQAARPAAAPQVARPAGPPPLSPAAPQAGRPAGPPTLSPAAAARPAGPPTLNPSAAQAGRPAGPPTLSPASAQAAHPASPAEATPPAPTPPAAPRQVDFAREFAELRERVERTKSMTAFELLGVDDKATSTAIKIAYFKLAKQLHPDTVPPGAPPGLAALKATLFAEVGEAYRRIGDDQSRAAYVEELAAGGSEVDVSRILKAEELFHRAELLVKGRRFAEAAAVLDEAIANNDEEGEYYAWRGYARFFALPDKKAARPEAQRDLQAALDKNPKCVAAYYYLGQIAKLSDDRETALRQFQKTVELDPHHIDAQRELRILGKK